MLDRPLTVLDVGCGAEPALAPRVDPGDDYWGVDFYNETRTPVDHYVQADLNTENLSSKLKGQRSTWSSAAR